ncbi:MAG: response regulator transcription factor, partial [Chloroflexi bacterium]|nr:response regulator transcription factor [Chloroflexota bacterium]
MPTSAEPRATRVLIVDDHGVVREGLRAYLELEADIEVVGEARDGAEGVRRAHELQPDVVLMDLVMPTMDGVDATSRIKQERPETHVIVLTSFLDDERVVPAIKAGATSY